MSGKGMQFYVKPLKSLTYNAGQPDTINLGEQLPKHVFGRIAHLWGIFFRVQFTAFTAASGAPTEVQMNSVVANMLFKDGFNTRFSAGGFNLLRVIEMLDHGRLVNPDPPNNGSGPLPAFGRWLPMGIPTFAGDPSDFVMPCAAMVNASIDLTYGSLAAIGASDATANIIPYAVCVALDGEIRVPPVVERSVWPLGAKKGIIQGRALYASAGLLNSLSYDAIATGAYGNIAVLTGSGDTPQTEASSLEKLFHAVMQSGQVSQVHGEPLSSQDVNPRAMNPATPTALQAADSIVAPVICSAPGSRISKMLYGSEGTLGFDWSGTNTAAYVVGTRINAQSQAQAAAVGALALDKLGMSLDSIGVKTLTKGAYVGPRQDFMPWMVNTK